MSLLTKGQFSKLLNKYLYFTHSWVGLVLTIFMFAWFLTGLVIIYSPTITQSRSLQLAYAETLSPEIGWLSFGDAWERSADQRKMATAKIKPSNPEAGKVNSTETGGAKPKVEPAISIIDARLIRSAGHPYWLVEDSIGLRFALSAQDGSLHETTKGDALIIAENWYREHYGKGAAHAVYIEKVDAPVILRNQEALKPFHRIKVGDEGGELLISARTGEVLHASDSVSRAFYWAGNWLHLLKPLTSLGWEPYRHDVQVWLGFAATLATLTGLIIGWLRWRPGFRGKPTYSQGRTQPYREFWFKWHFWSGLIGGTIALFWALSGYVSTNPGKIFTPSTPTKQEVAKFAGNGLPEVMRTWQPSLPVTIATSSQGTDVVELNWRRVGEKTVLLATTRDGNRLAQNLDGSALHFDLESFKKGMARINSQMSILNHEVLFNYDSYYYPRHDQSAVEKPLPVIALNMDDESDTRYYLDPLDGKILGKFDRSGRVYRWLYSALHHWDFGWLTYSPLWNVWMLTWVGFGLVLGGSSLIMGWRLLKKTFKPPKRKQAQATEVSSRYQELEA